MPSRLRQGFRPSKEQVNESWQDLVTAQASSLNEQPHSESGGVAAPHSQGERSVTLRGPHRDAQYIVDMARELKRMAARSGLARVALILEMAELEARDQLHGPGR